MEVFVIRLWPGDPAVRGKVEHAASGTSHVFDSGQELLLLLGEQLRASIPLLADQDAPVRPELEVPPA